MGKRADSHELRRKQERTNAAIRVVFPPRASVHTYRCTAKQDSPQNCRVPANQPRRRPRGRSRSRSSAHRGLVHGSVLFYTAKRTKQCPRKTGQARLVPRASRPVSKRQSVSSISTKSTPRFNAQSKLPRVPQPLLQLTAVCPVSSGRRPLVAGRQQEDCEPSPIPLKVFHDIITPILKICETCPLKKRENVFGSLRNIWE